MKVCQPDVRNQNINHPAGMSQSAGRLENGRIREKIKLCRWNTRTFGSPLSDTSKFKSAIKNSGLLHLQACQSV